MVRSVRRGARLCCSSAQPENVIIATHTYSGDLVILVLRSQDIDSSVQRIAYAELFGARYPAAPAARGLLVCRRFGLGRGLHVLLRVGLAIESLELGQDGMDEIAVLVLARDGVIRQVEHLQLTQMGNICQLVERLHGVPGKVQMLQRGAFAKEGGHRGDLVAIEAQLFQERMRTQAKLGDLSPFLLPFVGPSLVCKVSLLKVLRSNTGRTHTPWSAAS